jgi:hypothetical protein
MKPESPTADAVIGRGAHELTGALTRRAGMENLADEVQRATPIPLNVELKP